MGQFFAEPSVAKYNKVFCETKGIVPNSIEAYKTDSFGKFKGSFYRETNDNVHLKVDTLDALYPIDNDNISTIFVTKENGERMGFERSGAFWGSQKPGAGPFSHGKGGDFSLHQ